MNTKVLSASGSVTVERLLLTGREWIEIRDKHPSGFMFNIPMWEQFLEMYFVVFKVQIGSDPPRYIASDLAFDPDHFGILEEDVQAYLEVIDKQFNYMAEHLGEVVAKAAEMLIRESEVWKYGCSKAAWARKVWQREYDSLYPGSKNSWGIMAELKHEWSKLAQARLLGFARAHVGNSKVKLRVSTGGRADLRRWYERLKPICLRVRKAYQTRGDIRAAAKLFDHKKKTGISFIDNQESYLDDDLIRALGERKSNRQFKYKPHQIAAVQSARLTTSLGLDPTFRGITKIGMNQAREIMRLLSEG